MATIHDIQRALPDARVLLIGLGGLGAPAATALADAGVGTLGLVDPDVVEVSNLHRQPLYAASDVGERKVDAARRRLAARRASLRVETWAHRFAAGDAPLLAGWDVVLDGTDSAATKFIVNDAAVAARVPLVHAGATGWAAQLLTVLPGHACLRCLFEAPAPEDDVPACEAAGILGPVVVLAGGLQAAEAVRLVTGAGAAFADRLLSIDLRAGTWRSVPIARNPACAGCGSTHASPARRSAVR